MVKITSVGMYVVEKEKTNNIDCFDFCSKQSLSAYDIIIFSPRVFLSTYNHIGESQLKKDFPGYIYIIGIKN